MIAVQMLVNELKTLGLGEAMFAACANQGWHEWAGAGSLGQMAEGAASELSAVEICLPSNPECELVVSFEDIRALAHPVLRHRVLTNFHAQSEGVTTDMLVDRLLEAVPTPRSGM